MSQPVPVNMRGAERLRIHIDDTVVDVKELSRRRRLYNWRAAAEAGKVELQDIQPDVEATVLDAALIRRKMFCAGFYLLLKCASKMRISGQFQTSLSHSVLKIRFQPWARFLHAIAIWEYS